MESSRLQFRPGLICVGRFSTANSLSNLCSSADAGILGLPGVCVQLDPHRCTTRAVAASVSLDSQYPQPGRSTRLCWVSLCGGVESLDDSGPRLLCHHLPGFMALCGLMSEALETLVSRVLSVVAVSGRKVTQSRSLHLVGSLPSFLLLLDNKMLIRQ